MEFGGFLVFMCRYCVCLWGFVVDGVWGLWGFHRGVWGCFQHCYSSY